MIVITTLLILHLFFGMLNENLKSRVPSILTGIVLAMAAILFTVGIRDNSDWKMYYYFFKLGNEETDLMFVLLAKLFKTAGFEFADLYTFHMVSIIMLFVLVISRYTRNWFYVLYIFLVLDYVHLTNQIRYYFGFPILMLGLYYMMYRKKYTLSILLLFLALLFHKGLFMLLLFIPAYYLIPVGHYIRVILWLSTALTVVVVAVVNFGVGISLEHFDNYLGREYEASLMGGLFNALPYLIYLTFIYIEHVRLTRRQPEILNEPKNVLIMKLAFFPLLFLPASLLLQILGHRYIMPFSIFYAVYYLLLIRGLPEKERFLKMILFTLVHFAAVYSIYLLPDYFLSENHYLDQLKTALRSIPYFKSLTNP